MFREINFEEIINAVVGKYIPKPLSGTLSGHAVGEPFDKLAYQAVKSMYPNNAYRQFEYLNSLFSKAFRCGWPRIKKQAVRIAYFDVSA
jgi:type II restriction enzyme